VTYIYHITHINNLGRIVAQGGLYCDREAQKLKVVSIGHQHIKDRRLNRAVPLPPDGTVGDYVPFYFGPRSPMLFAINKGVVKGYAEGQRPIIYLRSTAEAVRDTGLQWVFTEGHAEIAYTDFFNRLEDLNQIDWNVINGRYWYDTDEFPDRKRKRQAEFLVKDFFPWNLVMQIGVYDQGIGNGVAEILQGQGPAVQIQRGWYY
jgi:ssDNA thymidine ADP-ribosyltransferase DarT-like protein